MRVKHDLCFRDQSLAQPYSLHTWCKQLSRSLHSISIQLRSGTNYDAPSAELPGLNDEFPNCAVDCQAGVWQTLGTLK